MELRVESDRFATGSVQIRYFADTASGHGTVQAVVEDATCPSPTVRHAPGPSGTRAVVLDFGWRSWSVGQRCDLVVRLARADGASTSFASDPSVPRTESMQVASALALYWNGLQQFGTEPGNTALAPGLAGGAVSLVPTELRDFALFGQSSLVIGDRGRVGGGWSGSQVAVTVGNDARTEGLSSGGSLALGDRTSVQGDARVAGLLSRGWGSTISGTVITGNQPALTLPVVVVDPQPGRDVSVWRGESRLLEPGRWGALRVGSGGKLVLRSGLYEVSSLVLEPEDTLVADVSAGPVRIRVRDGLQLGDRSRVLLQGGVRTSLLEIQTAQTQTLWIGTDVQFIGSLVAPAAAVHVGSRTRIDGAIHAWSVNLAPDAAGIMTGLGNASPTITSRPDSMLVANQEWSYLPTARDADQDSLIWSVLDAPDGLGIDAVTGEVRWVPSEAGLFPLRLRVEDGHGGLDTQTVVLTVSSRIPLPVDLRILTPADGAVLERSPVLVRWRLEGVEQPPYLQALLVGANRIERDTTLPDGRRGRDVVSVTLLPAPPAGDTIPAEPVVPDADPTVVASFARGASFLWTGADALQRGLDPSALDTTRLVVVRGIVADEEGRPLGGVRVGVRFHPEFGHTFTRATGVFDLAVNAMGTAVLDLEGVGYLPAQRTISVVRPGYSPQPEVRLVRLDEHATLVRTDGGTRAMQVAQGSLRTDESGARRQTILVPTGTTASLEDSLGVRIPADYLTIRATEYTVGPEGMARMPADLPPGVGYTYAVELSADEALATGAEHVRFSRPLVLYNENFLGFPVGSSVPVGVYERRQARWIPHPSGLVVRVLSVADGVAALDLDGDGVEEGGVALLARGISTEELRQVASLYAPGQTLWRASLDHFSTVDLNWGIAPPVGAAASEMEPPTTEDQEQCCNVSGSIIQPENRVLQEVIPLAGTGMRLVWSSSRVPEANRAVRIPLSGDRIPPNLSRIELVVSVAGRRFESRHAAQSGQSALFIWDGLDAYGRKVQGAVEATIRIGYVYKAIYTATPSFGNSTGMGIDGNRERAEFTFWSEHVRRIGSFDASASGLGGWSLDGVHVVDPQDGRVYKGDGDVQVASQTGWQTVYAPPTNGTVQAMDFAQDGGVWIVEQTGADRRLNVNLLRLDRNGVVQESRYIARQTTAEASWRTTDVSSCGDGTLVVSTYTDVFRVERSGAVVRVAAGVSPTAVACDRDGIIHYASGYAGGTVTRIEADNSRRIVVASGAMGLAFGPDGLMYIADWSNGRILRRAVDGTISTVLSGGIHPISVSFTRDGKMLIPQFKPGKVALADTSGVLMDLFEVDESAGYWLAQARQTSDGAVFVAANRGIYRKDLTLLLRSLLGQTWVPSRNGSEVWNFDAAGRHLDTRDALTGRILLSLGQDAQGRTESWTDASGRVSRLERLGNGIRVHAPDGRVHELELDGQGRLASVHEAGRRAPWTMGYNGAMLSTFREPDGAEHQFFFDEEGKLTRDEDALGGWQTLSWSDSDGVRTVDHLQAEGTVRRTRMVHLPDGSQDRVYTGADGLSTTTRLYADGSSRTVRADGTILRHARLPDPRWGYATDELGIDTVTLPSGLRSVRRHTRFVRLVDPSDPLVPALVRDTIESNGRRTVVEFDRSTRTVKTTLPSGRTSWRILDDRFRTMLDSVPGLVPTRYFWDERDRLDSVVRGGRVVRYTWNDTDRLVASTDPLGRSVGYRYDAVGRMTRQILTDGRELGFAWDDGDRMVGLTPPERGEHGFSYDRGGLDSLSWAPALESGDSTPTSSVYDLEKRPVRTVLPSGEVVEWGYDTAGRPQQVVLGTDTVRTRYDAKGRLASMTRNGQDLSWTWNGGVPASERWSGAVVGEVATTLDAEFRPSAQIVSGSVVAFGYDRDGALSRAGDMLLRRDTLTGLPAGDSLGRMAHRLGRNAHGEIVADTVRWGGTIHFLTTWERDSLGRAVGRTELADGVVRQERYHYDVAGRLDSVWTDGVLTGWWGYDANGVRIAGTGVGSVEVDAQDRVRSSHGASFEYDANGRLVARTDAAGTTRYGYDLSGGLRWVVLPSGDSVGYVLDPAGRRIARSLNGSTTHRWLWDGALRPVAELDASGSVLARYVYATHANVPDYLVRGGRTYRLVTDERGSVREVLDVASGEVVSRLEYDVWGNVTASVNSGFQPFGYAGGLRDDATGLVRFGVRDYDPSTGRWTAKDPIGFQGGDANLYGYVGNDPVNLVDPSGLYSVEDFGYDVAIFSVAFGDGASFGATKAIRQSWQDEFGVDMGATAVDYCSVVYLSGRWVGVSSSVVAGGGLLAGALHRGVIINGVRVIQVHRHALSMKVLQSAGYTRKVAGQLRNTPLWHVNWGATGHFILRRIVGR